jgi:hypothetical protein
MRAKYIEERHPRWFSMCVSKTDISNVNRIAFAHALGETDREMICQQHNKLLDAYIELAQEWSENDFEGFKEYWYG